MSTLSLCRQCLRQTLRTTSIRPRPRLPTRRAASTDSNGKPIVLEQPDAFRPPSHPQRLNRPRRAPAAYNQGPTRQEQNSQKSRSYPHMFPSKGTFMHWFLTDRWIHLWITMGTLTFLATITLTQSFLRTSPYAHLIPPISSFPLHPLNYISELSSVIRLHIDYETTRTNNLRQQAILDAQKRRLYRRAHGLENLDAEEESGIDVRGLVSWDDGLTNKERVSGGREMVLSLAEMMRLGMQPGENADEFTKRLQSQDGGRRVKMMKERGVDYLVETEEREAREAVERDIAAMEGRVGGDLREITPEGSREEERVLPERRKRKLWFGIW